MSRIVVRGEKVIARPIDVVKAQFVDMAHHEQTRVHGAIEISNARRDGGLCRFTSRRRMFGRLEESENEIVVHPDGNSTVHTVSGPNRGLVLRQTFEADGSESTRVRIEIEVPLKGMLRLLAPIVRKTVERDLAVALEEDRVDLEVRRYQPAG